MVNAPDEDAQPKVETEADQADQTDGDDKDPTVNPDEPVVEGDKARDSDEGFPPPPSQKVGGPENGAGSIPR